MSVYKMQPPQLMKFVELYRDQECLWDVNLPEYRDRQTRDRALEYIASEMGLAGFGPREVAQKIKNLRSSYCQELKRINESTKPGASPGEVYYPKVPWFPIIDSILRKTRESKPVDQKPNQKNCNTSIEIQDVFVDCNTLPEALVKTELPSREVSPENNSTPTPFDWTAASPANLYATDYSNPPNEARPDLSAYTEFDLWCLSLAKQLNGMETSRALSLQLQIQTLVSTERIAYEGRKLYQGDGPEAGSSPRPQAGARQASSSSAATSQVRTVKPEPRQDSSQPHG